MKKNSATHVLASAATKTNDGARHQKRDAIATAAMTKLITVLPPADDQVTSTRGSRPHALWPLGRHGVRTCHKGPGLLGDRLPTRINVGASVATRYGRLIAMWTNTSPTTAVCGDTRPSHAKDRQRTRNGR